MMASRPRRRVCEPDRPARTLVEAGGLIASYRVTLRRPLLFRLRLALPLPVADLVGLRLSRMRDRMPSISEMIERNI